ncbi:hypothetical protein EW145_g895 [Phellinidium pouzarii]|uniref:Calcineurin-like phosphoesterase domain-containing protein n=1 Tax=Phellinidium pouzarii TaxID=167371 RepID=A0A4S4LGJ5_9AGAM|nr:hypothetical protein EW145_g895 [Phellinidium pouzarii]
MQLFLSMMANFLFVVLIASATAINAQSLSLGLSSFAAPGAFPTSLYSEYFNNPTQTSAQVQPVISDPVTHEVYPFNLTNPATIPQNDTVDPHPLPPKVSSSSLLAHALHQIQLIAAPETENSPFLDNPCATCQAVLGIAKMVALAAPEQGPALAVSICQIFDAEPDCSTTVGPLALGNIITQVFANANVGGYDGQLICQNFFGACPLPPTSALNLTGWFAKPKPNPLPPPKTPSGKRLKVLHLSDFHLDPRYTTGAEANCSTGLCCREGNVAFSSPNQTLFPAPRFGTDTPYALAAAALQAIPVLAGTQETGFDFMIYTGDLVSHDPDNELSREYTVLFDLFKRIAGSGPVYASLGNHDTHSSAQDAPHSLGGDLATQFSWNYDHVAGLWEEEGWIPESSASLARAHYGAKRRLEACFALMSTSTTDQLDTSGMFRFLTDELQDAEDAGDRVWILGHVESGFAGGDALENPTNLFYQIVDRFSPHVIANIFWGHTHMDQLSIFYTNNGTNMSAETAQVVSWIGPSITPLTDLNSGFRVYEVDSNTFDILDAHTWRADVNIFPKLDDQITFAPTYEFEYDTRATYGKNISGWGPNDPLNATWWHLVTEVMEADPSLVTTFHNFQGKESVHTLPCASDCIAATICYMRSGSSSIASQNFSKWMFTLCTPPTTRMTRLTHFASYAGVLSLSYALVWFSVLRVPMIAQETIDQVLPVLPWWLLVSFGSYSLYSLGKGLYTFNDVPEAYEELLKEIAEAKLELRAKGVTVD